MSRNYINTLDMKWIGFLVVFLIRQFPDWQNNCVSIYLNRFSELIFGKQFHRDEQDMSKFCLCSRERAMLCVASALSLEFVGSRKVDKFIFGMLCYLAATDETQKQRLRVTQFWPETGRNEWFETIQFFPNGDHKKQRKSDQFEVPF